MTVRVSVVVPVYNNPEGIQILLHSLVNQTYPQDAYEIIVADNGSKDGTLKVASQFQDEHPGLVRVVSEDRIQSSYAARNRGILEARAEYLAFTDSDCIPSSWWLEAGMQALEMKKAPCGGGRIEFTYKSSRPNIYEYFDSARKLQQKTYVENAGFAATANFFASKQLFDRYGLFRSDLISGGDYEFGRRVTAQGELMIFMPDALVYHPARRTFREVYKKTRRIAIGQKQLSKLGLLQHGLLTWKHLLPARRWVIHPEWSSNLSRRDKLHLIVISSLLRWVNLWERIR